MFPSGKFSLAATGLARTPAGFVLFVPFTCPGEQVRVRVTERKAHYARAEVVEILQPGASREIPPCPYYARCGGCQYQHLSYAEECALKEAQVREAFARAAGMPRRARVRAHSQPAALSLSQPDHGACGQGPDRFSRRRRARAGRHRALSSRA